MNSADTPRRQAATTRNHTNLNFILTFSQSLGVHCGTENLFLQSKGKRMCGHTNVCVLWLNAMHG